MIERYVYTKQELIASSQILDYPNNGGTKKDAYIQNVLGNIYDENQERRGFVSFTNNTTVFRQSEDDKIEFTTSIGSIKTPHGKLVVNFCFHIVNQEPYLPPNRILSAQPTYTDGKYSRYKNITVSVQSFDDGQRILTIESLCRVN